MKANTSFLTPDDMTTLETNGEIRQYAVNEVIIQQDAIATDLYMVKSGIVQIDLSRLYGVDVLAYLGDGAMFGEVTLMDKKASSATASAAQPCELLVVPHETLERLFEEDEGFSSRFFRTVATMLAKRIRSTNTGH